MLKAIIFDVDGTMADTEHAHRDAFNWAFAQEGLDWFWDEPLYTELLEISGGQERLRHYWRQKHPNMIDIDGHGLSATIERLHGFKTAAYEGAVSEGQVCLRPGVLELIEDAKREGVLMAIATTTSPVNITALLRSALGPQWKLDFVVIEDASTAPRKKPEPDVYLQTLKRLKLGAHECIALEDSANGLQAATRAGLKTLITPTTFTAHHDFRGALRVLPSLAGVNVSQLNDWLASS